MLYRKYNIQVCLKDYNNKEISRYTIFYSIDIEEFNIILGYLQLVKVDLDIYQADSIQYFRPERKLLYIQSEETELIYDIKEFTRLVTLVVKGNRGDTFFILRRQNFFNNRVSPGLARGRPRAEDLRIENAGFRATRALSTTFRALPG